MKTIAVVSLMAIALGHAKPVARQSQVCNAAPAGTNSGNGPLSQPTAATAAACQQQCDANPKCLSFTFGLPNGATSPQCNIFGVAAAQVPAQSDPNIMVFDKACSDVSTTAPTSSGGSGNANSNVNPANTAAQGNSNNPAQGKNGNGNAQPRSLQERQAPQPPRGNVSPPPPPPPPGNNPNSQPRSLQERQTQPPRGNNGNTNPPPPPPPPGNNPNSQPRSLQERQTQPPRGNNGNTNPPPPPPAQGNNGNRNTQNRAVTGNANPPPQNNGNGQQGGPPPPPQGQNRKRANTCGATPAGPAGNAPTPIQTLTTIQTQDECLALCKQTTGCQSIEFGQPSADRRECQLFNTPAANLPPTNNGGSVVAFDVGC